MAAEERMGSLISLALLLIILNVDFIKCFNIDLNNGFIFGNNKPGSFFGYSIAINKELNSVIVGAPKGNEYKKGDVITQNEEWGSVYKCPVLPDSSNCELLNKVDDITQSAVNNPAGKRNQWMGASVYSDHKNVLSCAPRYTTKNSINQAVYLTGKCDFFNAVNPSKIFDYEFKPCETIASRLTEFEMCDTGLSSAITSTRDSTEVFAGVPAAVLGTGKIAISKSGGRQTQFTPGTDTSFSDYMGYAITTGKFKKDGGIVIVGGAPRGDELKGKVLMYDSASPDFAMFSSQIRSPSQQAGSYFGASLGAADINGDGFADLIVGAPQYANTKPNQGAVYVYLNNQEGGLVYTNQEFVGTHEDGFFGYSIGSVGDLNGDAMQDIAVGAPWAGDKGIVYLYYGTKSKDTPLVLKQTITPSDIKGGAAFDGFGFSFADFYPYPQKEEQTNNLDEEAYNDLAIGSFKSGNVVVLRSRPVITIVGELLIDKDTKIDLLDLSAETICQNNGKSFKCIKNVKTCFNIPAASENQNVKYTVEVDAQNEIKRGFLLDSNGAQASTLTKTLTGVGSTEKCSAPFNIFLKNNTKDILRAFAVSLKWEYEEVICPDKKICPIANKMLELSTTAVFPYVKGCSSDGNDECNCDLKVEMTGVIPGGGKDIALGITKKVTVVVEIANEGENAFINKLEVIYPQSQVSPTKVQIENFPGTVEWLPNVSGDSDVKTVGVVLSSPIKQNGIEKVSIDFSVLNVGKGSNVDFKATAITRSKEMKPADNVDTLSIPVTLSANLTVSGSVTPENIKWTKEMSSTSVVGPTIIHKFYFQNLGPSAAEKSEVLIKIPEKMGGEYILNIMKVTLTPGIGYTDNIGRCEDTKLNPLNLDLTKRNKTLKRRRREVELSTTVDCGDETQCMVIKCHLNMLKKSQNAVVEIESTLVEATFDKLKESREVIAFAKFSSDYVKRPGGAEPDQVNIPLNVNSPYLKVEKPGEPIAWWIILLCILGAVLIIGLIVFILYKKGFFKRKKHGEEEEEELRKGDPDDDY